MKAVIRCVISLTLLASITTVSAQGPNLRQEPLRVQLSDSTRPMLSKADLLQRPHSLVVLPAGAATAHYGFFCRQELKWDKKLPTQLRLRVGSHEACDRLEGKRRY